MLSVSVIVCTRNRAESLQRLLEALRAQRGLDRMKVELIVVDNGSSDTTKLVVKAFEKEGSSLRTKYLFVPLQGLARARNVGALAATGELLLFTDDDCIPDPSWIQSSILLCESSRCDALGGRSLATGVAGPLPSWIHENMDLLWGVVGHYDLGEATRPYESSFPPFIGANMCITAASFRELGLFEEHLGHGTGRLGEDTEYFIRLMKHRKSVWYNGGAGVVHVNTQERFSLRYISGWHLAKLRFLLASPSSSDAEDVSWYRIVVLVCRRIGLITTRLMSRVTNRGLRWR